MPHLMKRYIVLHIGGSPRPLHNILVGYLDVIHVVEQNDKRAIVEMSELTAERMASSHLIMLRIEEDTSYDPTRAATPA